MSKRSRRKRPLSQSTTSADVVADDLARPLKSLPRLPPQWPTSELDRLYQELGGPVEIDGKSPKKNVFQSDCDRFPFKNCLGTAICEFVPNESTARRHWPWVAFAIGQYLYEIKERARYTDEPTPKEILDLVKSIRKSSTDLNSSLQRVSNLADRLHDHSAPWRRYHLSWLDNLFSMAIARGLTDDAINNDLAGLPARAFRKQLAALKLDAGQALKLLNKDFLERERGQSNPALAGFIGLCAKIWKSMYGQTPSTRRIDKASSSDPPFVRFVRRLAVIGKAKEPSRKEIEGALRKTRMPPIKAQNFS
jgi:hypothetical protein